MKICKKCGNKLSNNKKKCPVCKTKTKKAIVVDDTDTKKIDEIIDSITNRKQGKPKKRIRKLGFILLVIIVLSAAGAAGYFILGKALHGENMSSKPESAASSEKVDSEKKQNKISYDNYLNIKIGATYWEVVTLLGKEGEESSTTEVDGVKTTIYYWQGANSSDINVSVQNNQIISKTQMGLKTLEQELTLEKYNQVVEGMTYKQVIGILGEGQIFAQSNAMGSEVTMYQWMNKDGSNANLTFQGDILQVKAQYNLK